MPNAEERAAILHAYIQKMHVAGDLDLVSMALRLDGCSPADVQVYMGALVRGRCLGERPVHKCGAGGREGRQVGSVWDA